MAGYNIKLPDLSVLIIDPDPYMRKIVRGFLSQLGAKKVIEAEDGKTALKLIHAYRPDVILTEWNLPVLHCKEMIELLNSPHSKFINESGILLMTNCSTRRTIIEAVELGIHSILCKPFSAKSLWLRLIDIMNKKNALLEERNNRVRGAVSDILAS